MSFFLSPVDHSRVKVSFKTTNQDTDYINANFIKVKVKYPCLIIYQCKGFIDK